MGYAKAKGEAVGVTSAVGWMQRHERCVYLIGGSVLAPIAASFIEPHAAHPEFHLCLGALGLVAVFANITAVWRTIYVMRRLPTPAPR
jgi:hypothetical protein